MKPRFFLSLILAIVPSIALWGSEPSKLSEKDQANLMEKAQAVQRAFETGDADTIIRSTHPAIIKLSASREQFETVARKAIESLKGQVTIEKTDWGIPTPTHMSGDDEVCFIPMTTIMRVGKNRGQAEVFLIAARQKGTDEWLFLDGTPLRKDPSFLWKLFPDLPKDVTTPPNAIKILK